MESEFFRMALLMIGMTFAMMVTVMLMMLIVLWMLWSFRLCRILLTRPEHFVIHNFHYHHHYHHHLPAQMEIGDGDNN
jgi:hypothetical protein